MDGFRSRGQESGSHLQDRGLSRSQGQQKLPPFRDVLNNLPTQSSVL